VVVVVAEEMVMALVATVAVATVGAAMSVA